MGKKSPPPKAPDLSPISNAQIKIAEQSNDLAREFLGLSREQYAWMKENAQEELDLARQQADRLFEFQNKAFASDEEAKAFARQVGQTQMDAMNLQMDYAKKDRERYEQTFLPMQDRMIAEANAYDTPERREAEAARAQVDIQRQAEAARNNADARLRSMGLDPSQMRSASLLQAQDVAMAAQQAQAGNQARQQVEDRGRALRADAINMGMGLPSQAAAGFQGSNASGAGAVNAGQAGQGAQLAALQGGAGLMGTGLGFRSQALGNLANLTGSPTQWASMGSGALGNASNAYGAAGNTMSQGFQNQMASWQAGQQQAQQNFSNIMSVASMAGGMMMAEGGAVRVPYYAEGGVAGIMRGAMQRRMGGAPQNGGVVGPNMGRSGQRFMAGAQPVLQRGAPPPMQLPRMQLPMPMRPMMAEGGIARERISPEKFPLASEALGRIEQVKAPGMAGARRPSTMESIGRGMAQSSAPGNSWDNAPMYQAQMVAPTNFQPLDYQAEGGMPGRARGALPRKQARDVLPAYLAEGEYVIPADVHQAKGTEFFDKLVAKYHRDGA